MKFLLGMVFSFWLLGCQSDEVTLLSDQKSMTKEEKEKTLKVDENQESDLLKEMGLIFEKDKIIIDLNKTDSFFLGLEKRADEKAKSIEKELEEINISRDAGILVEETKFSIDLNKSKKLLDKLSHIFEMVLSDVNSSN